MKTAIQLILLGIVIAGTYRIGQKSVEPYWRTQISKHEIATQQFILEAEDQVDRTLYEWQRPLNVGLYIGCGTGTVNLGMATISLRKVDYGVYMESCGDVSLQGVSIHDTLIEMEPAK